MSQKDTVQFSVPGSLWNLTTLLILKVVGTMTMEAGMDPLMAPMETMGTGLEQQMTGMEMVEAGMDPQYLGGQCHPPPPLHLILVESADKLI